MSFKREGPCISFPIYYESKLSPEIFIATYVMCRELLNIEIYVYSMIRLEALTNKPLLVHVVAASRQSIYTCSPLVKNKCCTAADIHSKCMGIQWSLS